MNANDVICVGAEPIALLDYIAVEEADPEVLEQIGVGPARAPSRPASRSRRRAGGAARADPRPSLAARLRPRRLLRRPRRAGRDRHGRRASSPATRSSASRRAASTRTASRSRAACSPTCDERPPELGGARVGETLLEPTVIYVRAVLRAARARDVDVRGLAHITGDGFLNLLRLEAELGYRHRRAASRAARVPLIAERGGVDDAELYEVFNMGCGFCVRRPPAAAAGRPWSCSPPPPGRRRDRRGHRERGRGRAAGAGADGRARRLRSPLLSGPWLGRLPELPVEDRHAAAPAPRPRVARARPRGRGRQVADRLDLHGGHAARSGERGSGSGRGSSNGVAPAAIAAARHSS